MHRRDLLASAATVAGVSTAGCLGLGTLAGDEAAAEGPTARLDMEPVSDADIARKVTSALGETYREFVGRVVEEQPVTTEAWHRPVHEGRYIYDGAVYALSTEVVDTRPAVVFGIELNRVEQTPAASEQIRFSALPEVDRREFEQGHLADGKPIGVGTPFVYPKSRIDESVLVPTPEYTIIVWDDTEGRFSTDDGHDTKLKTVRYTAEQVAPSAAAYGRRFREKFAFKLSGLSAAEREVVQAAIGSEEYRVPADATPSKGFESLTNRFASHTEVQEPDEPETEADGGPSGQYIARYDGQVYWTSLLIERRTPATPA